MELAKEIFEIIAAGMVGLSSLCLPNYYSSRASFIPMVKQTAFCLIKENLQEDIPNKTTTSSSSRSLNYSYTVTASGASTSTTVSYPFPSPSPSIS